MPGKFPGNRSFVTLKLLGDFRDLYLGFLKSKDSFPFLKGQMSVGSHRQHLLSRRILARSVALRLRTYQSLAVILAAGKGSRLGLVNLPKPMAEVGGRPVLGYGLESLQKSTFLRETIRVVVGVHKKAVVDYCGGDVVINEQKNLDGNLDALDIGLKGVDLKQERSILVMQADDCLTVGSETIGGMVRFHEGKRADITLLLTNCFDASAHRRHYILSGSQAVVSIDKLGGLMGCSNFLAGVFCFSGKFLTQYLSEALQIEKGQKEKVISTLFDLARENHCRVFGCLLDNPWVSINTPDQLDFARKHFSDLRLHI